MFLFATGQMQLLRTSSPTSTEVLQKEQSIINDVAKHGTLPIMKVGASYDYVAETLKVLEGYVKGKADVGLFVRSQL
jgi:hypothetical protein